MDQTTFTINNPSLSAKVETLKYIGPLITNRFNKEDIINLQDLYNLLDKNTKVQNTRFLRGVLTNPRSQECIGEPRYVKNPPHTLKPGYYTYCVRRVNRAAWYAITTYFRRKGIKQSKLPNRDPPRGKRELCTGQNKCVTKVRIPRKFRNKPKSVIEFVVLTLLKSKKPLSASQIQSISKIGGGKETKRKLVAVLRGNTAPRGRELFKRVASPYKVAYYNLTNDTRRILSKFSQTRILSTLRKL